MLKNRQCYKRIAGVRLPMVTSAWGCLPLYVRLPVTASLPCPVPCRILADEVNLEQMVSRLAALEWKAQKRNRRIEGSVDRKMAKIDFSWFSKTPYMQCEIRGSSASGGSLQ